MIDNRKENPNPIEEGAMYSSTTSKQLGIFGDGWIYRRVLKETGEHPLVKMRSLIDEILSRANKKLMAYYSPYEGRPSFSPSVLLKMLLLEYLYGLSDVQISKICVHDFLFRWFIGIEPTESVPDDTTLVKFRSRLGEEGFREVFHELIKLAKERGYTKGKLKAIDATHVFSDTPKLRPIALIKQGMRKVINKVKGVNKAVASNLSHKYRDCLKKVIGRSTEEIEKVRRDALRFVRDVRAKLGESSGVLLDVLEKVAMGDSLKLVSFTDLDARWGKKSPKRSFGGYKVHTICETENGLVTSVDVLPGNVNEGIYLPKLIEEEKSRGLEIKGIVADKLYDSWDNRQYLKGKIKTYIPSRISRCEIDKFDMKGGRPKCKAGKYPKGKIRQEEGELFYFSVTDCKECNFRVSCIGRAGIRKRVYLSDCRKLRTKLVKRKYKKRSAIERVFGQAKRWYDLDRARYRSRWKVAVQSIITFMAMDLKIMIREKALVPP